MLGGGNTDLSSATINLLLLLPLKKRMWQMLLTWNFTCCKVVRSAGPARLWLGPANRRDPGLASWDLGPMLGRMNKQQLLCWFSQDFTAAAAATQSQHFLPFCSWNRNWQTSSLPPSLLSSNPRVDSWESCNGLRDQHQKPDSPQPGDPLRTALLAWRNQNQGKGCLGGTCQGGLGRLSQSRQRGHLVSRRLSRGDWTNHLSERVSCLIMGLH